MTIGTRLFSRNNAKILKIFAPNNISLSTRELPSGYSLTRAHSRNFNAEAGLGDQEKPNDEKISTEEVAKVFHTAFLTHQNFIAQKVGEATKQMGDNSAVLEKNFKKVVAEYTEQTRAQVKKDTVEVEKKIDKMKRNQKILAFVFGGTVLSTALGAGFLRKQLEDSKKEFSQGKQDFINQAREVKKDAEHDISEARRQITTEIEDDINRNLAKMYFLGQKESLQIAYNTKTALILQYHKDRDSYWPRPWPSYKSIYNDKINTLQTEVAVIQRQIGELEDRFAKEEPQLHSLLPDLKKRSIGQ